jgi:hypothetical protein
MGTPNESNALDQLNSTVVKAATQEKKGPQIIETPESKKLIAMQAELLALELEEKKLAIQFQKANLVDMEERLAERELKRANIRQEAFTKGDTLKSLALNKNAQQKRCNHKKGGNGANGVVGGKGDSPDYALLTHTFAHGDVWVKCLRCHKTWKPPVESEYSSQQSFDLAMQAYKLALEFPTKNTPSGGVQFRYSDGGALYRENTKQVQMG